MSGGYGVVGVGGNSGATTPIKAYGVVGNTSAQAAQTHKEKHGIVGFFEHLGSDIRDATVGLPMGVVKTVEHPIRAAKETAAQTWQTWSPLVHGQYGKFAHDFAQHPLAPILDIAAVASLGLSGTAAVAAKVGEGAAVGSRAAKLAELATRNEIKVAGETADQPTMTQALSRHRGARFRQNITHELTGRANLFRDNASTYKHLSAKEANRQQIAINARIGQLGKAYKDLQDPKMQNTIFQHMYWQIRNGPARAVKVSKLADNKAPKGWRFVTENRDNSIFDHVAKPTKRGGGDFNAELRSVDQRFTTSDLTAAAKQRGGTEALIVPERAVRAYSNEAANSASFIRKAYDKPTRLWRAAVLNMRPAYVVNNAVGNAAMYMMNHGDLTGLRAWVDTVKQVKGTKAVDRLDLTGGTPRWMETHFGDEIANTFARSITKDFKDTTVGKAAKGVMPLNLRMETGFRRALINSEMRRAPEVQSLMKKGLTYDEAAAKALKGNPGLRTRVLEHAHNTLGDYNHMTKADRAIRDVIPFWAWDRTIARHTGKLVTEQAPKAAALAAVGQQGTAATEKALGEIPSFLKGAVPLPGGFGATDPGRLSILTTQGVNPYSTIPDLGDTVEGVLGIGNHTPSEAAGALVGPIPTIALEGLTGTRFSGAPIPDKGWGPYGNALRDMVVNLPPAQLIAAATNHLPPSTTIDARTGARKNKLYQKDWEAVVSSWLGFPNRKVDPTAAKTMAENELTQQQGKKKKKRKSTAYGVVGG